jgi:hypothetical protein
MTNLRILITDPKSLTLEDFIRKLDFEGSVVLLEGKREVIEADKAKMTEIARLLASKSKHIVFRSGNAAGADEFFAKGILEIDAARFQVITPYGGHRGSDSADYQSISLDEINLAKEPDVMYSSKQNAKAKGLIEAFENGQNKKLSSKASYLIRDTIKVTGTKTGIAPASFGIFYDDLRDPKSGGTGHTMKMCELKRVPYVDQRTWKKWLELT